MSAPGISRRDVLKGAGAVVGTAALAGAVTAEPAQARPSRPRRRPNFVVVFVDDLGYGDLGCYGSPLIKTPVLDGMARRGMRFTDFYAGAPTCTPSRASLLTGCYGARVNMPLVVHPRHVIGLPSSERTLAEYFADAGYATGMAGKWHLGNPELDPANHPMDHGFGSYFGIPYSNDMNPLPLYDGRTVVEQGPDQSALTRRFTEWSVEFVRAHADEPFFLYLAQPQPHEPLAAEAANRSAGGSHGDSVEEIDRYVGVLLDELTALGIRDDTCVIFTSDNGPWFVGSPGDFHGRKVDTYEGGIRVPFVVEWPGVVPRGTVYRQPAQLVDLLPTLLAAIDVDPAPDRPLDGTSILPALRSGRRVDRGDIFYYDDVAPAGHLNAIRRGDWKLHVRRVGGPYFTGRLYDETEELPQLFDLRRDPEETYDLSEHHPDVVAELRAALEAYDAELRADALARHGQYALR
jgi:arylsulfatase A